jgi:hypothetical protein
VRASVRRHRHHRFEYHLRDAESPAPLTLAKTHELIDGTTSQVEVACFFTKSTDIDALFGTLGQFCGFANMAWDSVPPRSPRICRSQTGAELPKSDTASAELTNPTYVLILRLYLGTAVYSAAFAQLVRKFRSKYRDVVGISSWRGPVVMPRARDFCCAICPSDRGQVSAPSAGPAGPSAIAMAQSALRRKGRTMTSVRPAFLATAATRDIGARKEAQGHLPQMAGRHEVAERLIADGLRSSHASAGRS